MMATQIQSGAWRFDSAELAEYRREAAKQARKLNKCPVRISGWSLIIGQGEITMQTLLTIDGREFAHNTAL